MWRRTIRRSQDLVTSIAATKQGFIDQAFRKTEKGSMYIEQARHLHETLLGVDEPADVLDMGGIREMLVAASGFSDKGAGHLQKDELDNALLDVLTKIERASGEKWREEIVSRFLLTRGDSFGGMMRNMIGAIASRRFADAVAAAVRARGTEPQIKMSQNGKVQTIEWPERTCLFDKTPRFIQKNIDVILLRDAWGAGVVLENPDCYLACGELKGGIDPAGADEHWKTAQSALDRIRDRFDQTPCLFFVGAAIELAMAEEIFADLQSGKLTYAANMTVQEQLSGLAAWLVGL
ncbi:MAG TPA: AvaI/BsoBI family type II restriction endonuclease [Bacillota bacterium]|nr:AvaI/BsoBI family type II restriction endonuclease [Bacillota bacterium]